MKLKMYTLSTCPWCRKTKKFFKDRNLPFEFIDYDLAPRDVQEKIAKEMMQYTDHIAFPFLKIDGQVVVGYNPEKWEAILSQKQVA